MQNIFLYTRKSRGFPIWARYAITTLIILIAFGIRLTLWKGGTGYPYLVFFPAIIVVSILFDHGTGIYAVILSTLLAIYFFVDPAGSLSVARPDDVIAIVIFVITGIATAILIEALHVHSTTSSRRISN